VIELQKQGGLWQVMLNRPDKANSLTRDMLQQLVAVANDARGAAKVLVITGAGKVFSAGADLEQTRSGLATSGLWEQLSGTIAGLPCLTIAALNGTLAGGAFGMALACDLRVSVHDARFFYPVMRLGFLPQPSDPVRLQALIGPARSRMILMAGQKIGADEALSWGLVDRVVARADLADSVRALAADALAADLGHIGAVKSCCTPG